MSEPTDAAPAAPAAPGSRSHRAHGRAASIGPRHGSGDSSDRAPRRRAERTADRAPRRRSGGSSLLSAVTEVVVVLAMALVLSLLIKTFLVQAFFIPSQSMEDTLVTGDRVVVSKLTPGPFALHRGDVVVFKDPGNWLPAPVDPEDGGLRRVVRRTLTFVGLLPQDSGEHLVKRVIGVPGDTVACCDTRGRITVNGVALTEPYLYPGDSPSATRFRNTVPADHLWVMGDHRSVSRDSRYNDIHFVPIENVVGKAFLVVWPLGHAGGVRGSGTTFDAVPDRGS